MDCTYDSTHCIYSLTTTLVSTGCRKSVGSSDGLVTVVVSMGVPTREELMKNLQKFRCYLPGTLKVRFLSNLAPSLPMAVILTSCPPVCLAYDTRRGNVPPRLALAIHL